MWPDLRWPEQGASWVISGKKLSRQPQNVAQGPAPGMEAVVSSPHEALLYFSVFCAQGGAGQRYGWAWGHMAVHWTGYSQP